jgi:hypothetical protein
LEKVTRRKGETASGSSRSNGYAHKIKTADNKKAPEGAFSLTSHQAISAVVSKSNVNSPSLMSM